ncbi:hypothetical protein [Embleya sp. NPDC020886]|uniref:hypothetical protein n=1 Tax=Embleya sp. NPDC020886 TaxID=3363980 RepID=UPI00379F8B07
MTIPAALAHDTIGTNPAATALLGAAGVGITVAAWSEASKRSPRLRTMATVSAGAASTYLTAATVAGPTSPNVALLQALGGGTLALWWNLRHALRNSASEGAGDGLLDMVGLARTQVVNGQVVAGEVSAELQLPRGEMVPDDVQQRIPHMASALGTTPGAIRVTPNRDNHSRVTLSVTPVDHLRKSVLYPGPSLPGQSIGRPVRLGVYQDGRPLEFWLPGTEDRDHPRPLSHLLTTGMSGSGKSGSLKVVLIEAMTRSDVVVWLGDPSKGSQSVGAIRDGLDWCETTPQGVEALLDVLPIVVKARADLLGRLGYAQWEPECWTKHQIPLLLIHFEESADDAVADHPNVVKVAQQARSTGTVLSFSLQRASYAGISTEVRAQFGTSLIFGVKDDTDAFTLDGAAKAAGASPEQWAADRAGMLYLQAPGVDRERWPIPARAYRLPDDEQVRRLIAAYDAVRPQGVDAATAKAAGPRYAACKARSARHSGREERPEPGPLRTALAERPRVPAHLDEAEIMEGETMDDAAEFEATEQPYAVAHESDLDADADPDTELEEPAGVVQVSEPEFTIKRPAEDARAEMLAILEELRAEGRAVCAPKDFPESRVGRSRTWVSRRLAEFADSRREVAENPGGQLGSWLIVPRDDAFEDYAA